MIRIYKICNDKATVLELNNFEESKILYSYETPVLYADHSVMYRLVNVNDFERVLSAGTCRHIKKFAEGQFFNLNKDTYRTLPYKKIKELSCKLTFE